MRRARPCVVTMLALTLAGCGRDIRLGGSAADAGIDSPDAPTSPFTAGGYTLTFLEPSVASCDGSLAGQEPTFEVLTIASERLVGGAVDLATPTFDSLMITGDPVMSAVHQPAVTLQPAGGGAPPGIWDTLISGAFGGGPASTDRVAIDVAVDRTTAAAAGGIEGQLTLVFATTDATGSCSLAFGLRLTRP